MENPSNAALVREHRRLTRRFFLGSGAAGVLALRALTQARSEDAVEAELQTAIQNLESYFTPSHAFRDVSRGMPIPHTLTEEKRLEVGLTRESWRLEVIADPDQPAKIRRPLARQTDTALDFNGLMQLAANHSVQFAKVMTCLNIGCPLGMGVWEGVPLREVIWQTQPREDLRRVFYYGYHNDDPAQIFRSSLPIGRVLEDPFGLPPVILCYKLNGEWLSPERGGPVRMVVPEAYGFKCIKWLTHVVLTNLAHANDTYADGNNDIDSPLKTFCATLSVPSQPIAHQPLPVTGYAQVGIGGLSKVQVWIHSDSEPMPADDTNFADAPWKDAHILPPSSPWSGLPDGRMPPGTLGFDGDGQPRQWPMPLTKIHWAALLPGLPAGDYTLRSRTIDANGHAQPMPRPFRKSGHAAIEAVAFTVRDA